MLPFPLAALVLVAPPSPESPRALDSFADEAVKKFGEGDLDGGFRLLDAAQKAYPGEPKPHWMRGQVYLAMAGKSIPAAAAWYRVRAEDELETVYWNRATTHDEKVNLQILLDDIHDADYPAVMSRDPKALEAFQEAEKFFGAKEYEKARAAYKKAHALDPHFVMAMLYVGDTFTQDLGQPEPLSWYRKAAEAQPNYPKAWRYLSDGCIEAGKLDEAEDALLAGLAGHPGNRLLWIKLADLREYRKMPLRKLPFDPPFEAFWNKDGQLNLKATTEFLGFSGKTIWPALLGGILGSAKVEVKNQGQGASPIETAFQKELLFWTIATEILETEAKKSGQPPQDHYLGEFLRFKKEGHLEAALFVLRYQEAFRPDFEAWKKAHPGGVQAFIREYGYRP